ncbi:hypothetical protein NFI96_008798 [Prochilodus magdalenae]|nr:hypothetical protein NFI96_008798 [Prochilodus magdalenae]
MRSTQKVSVWPVAFVGGLRYESPKINTMGKVYGWRTVFDPHRPFAIDMAGFAVNLQLILSKPQAYFKLKGIKGGYQESSLLRELVTLSDLEPKADNCTKLEHPHTVPADGAVGVEVEGHQAFWTCDDKPFILVLTTVPPHMDSLVVSTKTKAGLVTEDDPLPF